MAELPSVSSVIKDWRDVVTIASTIFGAWQFWRAENAKQAERDTRHRVFRQRSARAMEEIAADSQNLADLINDRKFLGAIKLAVTLGATVSNAAGFCASLLTTTEQQEMVAATELVQKIISALPISSGEQDQEVSSDLQNILIQHSLAIMYSVQRIAGRLQYMDDLDETQSGGASIWQRWIQKLNSFKS